MKLLPDWLKNGYLRVIDPVANWLVRRGVHPNTITIVGTLCTVAGGVIYATGHIRTGGWFLGLTALFDVLDGTVARRSNKSSTFGAFLDSTLDRVADGALLGGLAVFYALNPGAPQRPDDGGVSARPHRRVHDVVHPRARRGARASTRRSG